MTHVPAADVRRLTLRGGALLSQTGVGVVEKEKV